MTFRRSGVLALGFWAVAGGGPLAAEGFSPDEAARFKNSIAKCYNAGRFRPKSRL